MGPMEVRLAISHLIVRLVFCIVASFTRVMSRPSSAAILVNDFESLRGNGDGVSFAFAFASNYRCGQRPFIGALSLSLVLS